MDNLGNSNRQQFEEFVFRGTVILVQCNSTMKFMNEQYWSVLKGSSCLDLIHLNRLNPNSKVLV